LAFYSHVENTCTTASIQGGFGPTNSLTPPLVIAVPVAVVIICKMSDESVNNGLRLFDEKKKLPYLFIHLFIYFS
jgi:hypothetical protein